MNTLFKSKMSKKMQNWFEDATVIDLFQKFQKKEIWKTKKSNFNELISLWG